MHAIWALEFGLFEHRVNRDVFCVTEQRSGLKSGALSGCRWRAEHVLLSEHPRSKPVPHLTSRCQHLQWHLDSSVPDAGAEHLSWGSVGLGLPGLSRRPLIAPCQSRTLLPRPHILQREPRWTGDRWAERLLPFAKPSSLAAQTESWIWSESSFTRWAGCCCNLMLSKVPYYNHLQIFIPIQEFQWNT